MGDDHVAREMAATPSTPARAIFWRSGGAWRRKNISGAMMPPWTSSGWARLEPAGADPFGEDRAERPEHAADVAERDARRRARPPSAISRSQIGGKCGRASASSAIALDEGADLVLGGRVW